MTNITCRACERVFGVIPIRPGGYPIKNPLLVFCDTCGAAHTYYDKEGLAELGDKTGAQQENPMYSFSKDRTE